MKGKSTGHLKPKSKCCQAYITSGGASGESVSWLSPAPGGRTHSLAWGSLSSSVPARKHLSDPASILTPLSLTAFLCHF